MLLFKLFITNFVLPLGLTQGAKENSIDDSKPNPYKNKKKNSVMAVDEKIDSALTAMGSFFQAEKLLNRLQKFSLKYV